MAGADPARFWDRMADGYAKKAVGDPAAYEKTLERTRGFLSSEDEVLEVGCGTGTTALRLAPFVERITASDLSPRMIEIAREKAASQGVQNVRFEPGTLYDEKLEPGAFDVVMAFNLLHLLEDVPGAVRRIRELVKPGGLFVSKTVCLQSLLWGVPLGVLKLFGFAPRITRLKVAELEALITAAGFEILETGSFPASPPSRYVVARRS